MDEWRSERYSSFVATAHSLRNWRFPLVTPDLLAVFTPIPKTSRREHSGLERTSDDS